MYTKLATIVAAGFVLGTGSQVLAQDPTRLPAIVVKAPVEKPGARILAGVVRDTFALGIDSVEISIPSIQRRVFSDGDGKFRLSDIRGGKYSIRARKIGYAPQIREIVVENDGGVATFKLLELRRALPPVVTTGRRGGLSGIVGDTAYRSIVGAHVRLLAEGRDALTDSVGGFYFDVKPGQHAVVVSHEGYADKLVSVTVPDDSGRHVSIFLPPRDHEQSVREAGNIMDLGARLAGRILGKSMFYTHEDLVHMGWEWLIEAVRHGSNVANQKYGTSDGCWGTLNGGPKGVLITTLTVDEVESVEIYPSNAINLNLLPNRPQTVGNPMGKKGVAQSRIGTPITNTDEASLYNLAVHPPCPTVYVWTR